MWTRREFGRALGAGGAAAGLAGCRGGGKRPNILWITSEDNGPFLGCYGDAYARTPHLDRLAAGGVLFENCFAAYPVCAPSRCTLITGVWANSLGTHHMRSVVPLPGEARMLPSLLREAGYYCTNNAKEDYNTPAPGDAWDESSRRATYRNRRPGQPFFHVLNLETTHESSLFRPHRPLHDPAGAVIPPYHPDTPLFRQNWAQYYDHVTRMDEQAGAILGQLEEDGLAGDTIVFYFSDNGGVLPRSKRFVYDSGTHVPLIVRIPERLRRLAPLEPGTRTDRLAGFVDFAPTVLNLAGLPIPDFMQGRPFLGPGTPKPRDYIFTARDRMGSCPDMARSARDKRFHYIRNYFPHLPAHQRDVYQMGMPAWVEIERLHEEGRLNPVQERMFQPKPSEELYDTEEDPHEVNDLAARPEFRDVLERMRAANDAWLREIRDTGFLPELDLHRLPDGMTPYAYARDPLRYPLDQILEVAGLALAADAVNAPMLARRLESGHPAVQFWAATGLRLLDAQAEPAAGALRQAMGGSASPNVRMAAAEALCRLGDAKEPLTTLTGFLEDPEQWTRFYAAVTLGWLGGRARAARPALEKLVAGEKERYPKQAAEEALRRIGRDAAGYHSPYAVPSSERPWAPLRTS